MFRWNMIGIVLIIVSMTDYLTSSLQTYPSNTENGEHICFLNRDHGVPWPENDPFDVDRIMRHPYHCIKAAIWPSLSIPANTWSDEKRFHLAHCVNSLQDVAHYLSQNPTYSSLHPQICIDLIDTSFGKPVPFGNSSMNGRMNKRNMYDSILSESEGIEGFTEMDLYRLFASRNLGRLKFKGDLERSVLNESEPFGELLNSGERAFLQMWEDPVINRLGALGISCKYGSVQAAIDAIEKAVAAYHSAFEMITPCAALLTNFAHPIRGQIQVIFGPMFSGKTTELIRRCKRYQQANYECCIVKYAKDNRYSQANVVSTHDEQNLPAIPAVNLEDVKDVLINSEVIGIDEGQFFSDTVSMAEHLANLGKIVIVAALDGTYMREGFGDILKLVPLAESVIKLTAVCMNCYKDAAYTKRISKDNEVEVIGGKDKYMAVCRECYPKTIQPPISNHSENKEIVDENSAVKSSPAKMKKRKSFEEIEGEGEQNKRGRVEGVVP